MNKTQKFDFLLEHLKLSTQEVAKEFGVTNAFISQLRTYNSKRKLRKMHILAFIQAFDIPAEIFDDSVQSKEEIVALLKKKETKRSVLKQRNALSGVFYLYNHALRDSFEPLVLTICDNEIFLNESDTKIGELIELSEHKIVLILEYKLSKISISIHRGMLNSKAFFVHIEIAKLTQEIESSVALMSLEQIPSYDAQSLLGSSTNASITHSMLTRLQEYFSKEPKPRAKEHLYGIWHLSYNESEHIVIIERNKSVFLYSNNQLRMKGVLKDRSIFLEDEQKNQWQINLAQESKGQLKAYIHIKNALHIKVWSVGVLSKNKPRSVKNYNALSKKELRSSPFYPKVNREYHNRKKII